MDNPVLKVDMNAQSSNSGAQSFIVSSEEDKKQKSKKQKEESEEKDKKKKSSAMTDKFIASNPGRPLINLSSKLGERLKSENIALPTEKDSLAQIIQKINKIDKILKEEKEHPIYSYFRKNFEKNKNIVAKNLATISHLISLNPYKDNNLNINPFISFEKNKK